MHNPYRPGANRFYIAEQAIAGKSQSETFNALRPMVESETLVFKRNPTRSEKAMGITTRIPLASKALQLQALRDEIGRVYHVLGLSIGRKFDEQEIPRIPTPPTPEIPMEEAPVPDEIPTPEEEPEDEEIPEAPETPIAKGKMKIREEVNYFIRRCNEIRDRIADRVRLGETALDWISNRPSQAAIRLIPKGIPADALLYTMTLHWSADSRQSYGISDYDMVALSKSIMEERNITEIVRKDGRVERPHVMFGYVLTLAECRIPIFLVGEFGTGKSWLAGQIADYLGVDYGETPMCLGATRGDLLGRFTANPDQAFIAARFAEIYGNGGVFNFEEFDAGDPGLLIVLNNAMAGNHFYNSMNGDMIERSPEFIAVATGNTYGYGANTRYTAREHLDEATLDRWRMGRVWVDFDRDLEQFLADSYLDSIGISK